MTDPLRPNRRAFLKISVITVAAGSLGLGCGDDDAAEPGAAPWVESAADEISAVFPQAFASGDPSPSSVLLWTRVEPEADEVVDVEYQVSADATFVELIAEGAVSVDGSTDHTLRLRLTELSAGATLYYRFRARGVTTDAGRTKTAPAADADAPARFAFASCQDFNGRYYHAWRATSAQAESLDFVVFLGDYIYETASDARFQEAGGRRTTVPDGLDLDATGDAKAALTLADYRSLYRQYRSDPELQAVHKVLPFVIIWDDHEFADDCWQDHATHFNEAQGDEQDPARRTAANQAWHEYQLADVSYEAGASYPDDLRIYRTLRWGAHFELVLTDQRAYRDDHRIPEGPENAAVGKFFPNSSLGARQFVFKAAYDQLESEGPGSMLGATQKQWFIDTMRASNATWKFWGSEVMAAQYTVDLGPYETVPEQYRDLFYWSVDQWDGFRSERREILEALTEVSNVVVITGDLHSFHAAHLRPDFDVEGPTAAVEFVTAGISSRSFQEITGAVVAADPLLGSLGLEPLVEAMDELVGEVNPHFAYTQTKGYGVATALVTAEQVEVDFWQVSSEQVLDPDFAGQPELTHRLRVAAGSDTITPVEV